jgi:hypothetical protein
MNVRLQTNLEFSAGIYYNDTLRINRYTVSLRLCTATSDHEQINIAMDRVKMFVYSELADTVFINQNDLERAQLLYLMGINVTTLPEEPIDQIVGLMLYCKLNAVMEDRMLIETLDISSLLGDDVVYLYETGDPIGPFQSDGWWQLSDTSHNAVEVVTTQENIVKVPTTGWNKYNLNWHDANNGNTGKTVSFGKLSGNEEQSIR